MFGSFATTIALAAAALLTVSGPLGPLSLRSDVPQHLESSWDQSYQGSNALTTVFRNVKTDKCLEAESNGKVFTRWCNRAYSQVWELFGKHPGMMILKNGVTKKCLEMSLEGRVSTATCTNSEFQLWDITSKFIRNRRTNMCLNENTSGEGCYEQPNMRWNRA